MSPHVTVALAWTLVHALWQTSVLALLYALWRHRTAASSSRRYHVASSVLVVAFAAALSTFAGLMAARLPAPTQIVDASSGGSGFVFERIEGTGAGSTATPVPPSLPRRQLRLSDALTGLSWVWLAGSLAFAARIGGGLWLAWRIRRRARASTCDAVARAFARVAPHLPTRHVALLESDEIASPATLGWRRPAILVPNALARHGSADILEPLLAHELAHVRSHDYAANLVQSAIDALLFFCPGVRWLSADVRRLREYRCDDAAAALMAGPDVYVRALAGIAESERRFLPLPVPGAAGPRLAERAQRLLEGEAMNRLSPFRLVLVAGSVVTLVAAGARMAPSSWAAAAEKAPATTAAAPPPSSAPSAAMDPSIARELETIPISGSTCTTDCVVRVEEVRRGTDSLMDTVRLRNQTDQVVTSVVLTGFLETNFDPKNGGMAPVVLRRTRDIPLRLAPGGSVEIRARVWPVRDDENPMLTLEKMVPMLKEGWRQSYPLQLNAHVEVTEATKADGTKWDVVLQTEPMSPEANRLAPKDCVTPNGHKVKHGSGFPTRQDGPPPQCLGGRWFQHGQATKAAAGENEFPNIPISGSTCTDNCVVRIEEVYRGTDSLIESVRLRNQTDAVVTSVIISGFLETHWDQARPRPTNFDYGPKMSVQSQPIPLDLAPGAAADVRVRLLKRIDAENQPLSVDTALARWDDAWKNHLPGAVGPPPPITAHTEVVKVTKADGREWGLTLKPEPLPPVAELGEPRGCTTSNGHVVTHGGFLPSLELVNATNGDAPRPLCFYGRWTLQHPPQQAAPPTAPNTSAVSDNGDVSIPASAAPCPDGCPVRIESFRSTDEYLFETVTLRNVGTKPIRSVHLITFFEHHYHLPAPRQSVTSHPIAVNLPPGATIELKVGQAPMRRRGPQPTSDEERGRPDKVEPYQFAMSEGKGPLAWPNGFHRVSEFKRRFPQATAHIDVFQAEMADGTRWGALDGVWIPRACGDAASSDSNGNCDCDHRASVTDNDGPLDGRLLATNGFVSQRMEGGWAYCKSGRWLTLNQ